MEKGKKEGGEKQQGMENNASDAMATDFEPPFVHRRLHKHYQPRMAS